MDVIYYDHSYSNALAFVKCKSTGETKVFYGEEYTEENWIKLVKQYTDDEDFQVGLE